MYEMLTGRLPFIGATPLETLHHICYAQPEPIRRLNEQVSPELEALVHKCLEKEPESRYKLARDIAADLKKLGRPQRHGVVQKSDPHRHNLPLKLTKFIGRKRDVTAIHRYLSAGSQIVLISGPAGVGKSRVALQVALELSSDRSVFYVDLDAADDGAVYESVAAVLRCPAGFSSIRECLQEKSALLVLDNCDRVLSSCVELGLAVVHNSSRRPSSSVSILLTSRAEARFSGPRIYRLAPLDFPKSRKTYQAKDIKNYESVRLFIERAEAASGFKLTDQNADAVADICHRLDGIPLAIEMAAARLRNLSLDHLRDRLGLRLLNVGMSSAASRHQGLRAAIEWSWETLSSDERVLFRRLSVSGDWSLESIEAICSAPPLVESGVLDILSRLADKSFVLVEERHDQVRYRVLQILSEYGLARLQEAGEYETTMSRYAHYYLDSKRISLSWLHMEGNNLRAALYLAAEHEPTVALGIAQRMWRLWFVRKDMIATALEKMADQAFRERRWIRACTLLAAARMVQPPLPPKGAFAPSKTQPASMSETGEFSDIDFQPFDAPLLAEDQTKVAKSQIGREVWDQAWQRGSSLSLEDAIDYALSNAD